MVEEELQKRFTDCVYFLASPLTCKKGIECEFRHNEIARLNPRDCWYWLGGCCYNPDCAFRHPPLEAFKEPYHEPLNPVEKTNIPCYFYSKGFCNKADRCPFLHEPNCNQPNVNNETPGDVKLANTEQPPVETIDSHPDPPDTETIVVEHTDTYSDPRDIAPTVVQHTPDFHQSPSGNESVESEENENVETMEREEFVQFVQSESDVYNDLSSDGYAEPEKWTEGVLYDAGRREYVDDDVDFFSVNDEEHREVGFHYLDHQHYQHYDRYELFDKVSEQPRVSIFNRLSFKKRSLRDRLTKSKGVDFDHLTKTKGVNFNRSNFHLHIRPRGSRGGEVDFDHRGWLRKPLPDNRYKPPLKKPRFFASEVPRIRKPRQQGNGESWLESTVFTGPKTLEQIKEEKKRAPENLDFGSKNRTGSDSVFQGPRPLSEILKNKRKMG